MVVGEVNVDQLVDVFGTFRRRHLFARHLHAVLVDEDCFGLRPGGAGGANDEVDARERPVTSGATNRVMSSS